MKRRFDELPLILFPNPCSLIPVPCFFSTGGEVANAQVCKTCIRGFNPRPVLQILSGKQKGRAST
jgi:hypothetical protein